MDLRGKYAIASLIVVGVGCASPGNSLIEDIQRRLENSRQGVVYGTESEFMLKAQAALAATLKEATVDSLRKQTLVFASTFGVRSEKVFLALGWIGAEIGASQVLLKIQGREDCVVDIPEEWRKYLKERSKEHVVFECAFSWEEDLGQSLESLNQIKEGQVQARLLGQGRAITRFVIVRDFSGP